MSGVVKIYTSLLFGLGIRFDSVWYRYRDQKLRQVRFFLIRGVSRALFLASIPPTVKWLFHLVANGHSNGLADEHTKGAKWISFFFFVFINFHAPAPPKVLFMEIVQHVV